MVSGGQLISMVPTIPKKAPRVNAKRPPLTDGLDFVVNGWRDLLNGIKIMGSHSWYHLRHRAILP